MSFPEWNDPSFEEAWALQREVGLIDMHVDPIIQQRLFRYDIRKRHRPGLRGQPFIWHSDIPRMRDAAYGGVCLGIHYYPWQSKRAWPEMNRQIDYLDRVAEEDPGCMRIRRVEDWDLAKAEGKLGLAPGVEGAHMLNGELSRVADLAARSVGYLTLTHFSKNDAATPSMGRGANERDGLTPFGRDLIEALNAHGIPIDVAHVNTPGVLEVCQLTKAPLLCTHTGLKSLRDVSRNISDEEIDAIAETDGVIGIIFAVNFLTKGLRATSDVILDHIAYVARRVGVRHLCIGSDYDGWVWSIPKDQRDCRDIIRVTSGLLERGFSKAEVRMILRDNVLRVMKAAASARTIAQAQPSA